MWLTPRKSRINGSMKRRYIHQIKAESAWTGLQNDSEEEKQADRNMTSIAFVFMKTLQTPVLTTGICYYKRRLWTYCLDIHDLCTNQATIKNNASHGPQEIGSCLLHYIKKNVATKQLTVYSNQCGGQNCNIKISLLHQCMVVYSYYIPEDIHYKFFVSMHSHLEFSVIEKNKKYHPIHTPFDWVHVVTSQKNIHCH
ncbi:hypothetical protein PR048_012807, partial [Dryococelus australis]